MKYFIFLVILLFAGCASKPKIVNTEYGQIVPAESTEDVLKVLATNQNKNAVVMQADDHFLLFLTPKPKPASNPIVIASDDLTKLKILLNQYTDDGWRLSGSISTSAKLGKVTYYATLLK